MTPTDVSIPSEVFNFIVQSTMDTWNLEPRFQSDDWPIYDKWKVEELPLCMQKIKDLADSFPFW